MSSPLNGTRIAIIGHRSADLEGVAAAIPDAFATSIAFDENLSYEFAEFAAVVLAISAHEGAPNTLIKAWEEIAEFQVPRMILVTKIDEPEADFDEAIKNNKYILVEFYARISTIKVFPLLINELIMTL